MFLGLNMHTGNLFFTSNFHSAQPELHTFILIPQAWTLSLEILFYIVAPFILKKGVKKVLLFFTISLLIRYIIAYGLKFQNDPWNYRFFPSELTFFLLGYFSYKLLIRYRGIKLKTSYNLIILIFLSLTILYYNLIPDYQFAFIPFGVKQLIFSSLFIILLPILLLATEKNKVDRAIGELSFPIYMSHIFVSMSLGMYGYHSSLLILIISILLSLLINIFVSDKIEKIRQRRLIT